MDEELEVPLDVGQLVLQVVAVRLLQIIDDLPEVEVLEFLFGEVIFVDKRVDDGEEEVGIYVVCFADGLDCVVAHAEAYAKAVDDGHEGEVALDGFAHFHVGVDQRHGVGGYGFIKKGSITDCMGVRICVPRKRNMPYGAARPFFIDYYLE